MLQVVLAAPLKLPGKAGNILKYIALGLGILETVIEEEKPPPEEPGQPGQLQGTEHREASGRNGSAGVSTDKGDAAGQAAGDESGQLAVTAHDDAGGTGERSGGDEDE